MMGGRLLTGGIPGEAAVWGCSRPSPAPSVSPPPSAAAAAPALRDGNLRLHPGQPQGGAPRRGSAPRRGVCRVGAASWDQLVALENRPHTHAHTPLLCCRLPLREQRQREDACASHRPRAESGGDGDRLHLLLLLPGKAVGLAPRGHLGGAYLLEFVHKILFAVHLGFRRGRLRPGEGAPGGLLSDM